MATTLKTQTVTLPFNRGECTVVLSSKTLKNGKTQWATQTINGTNGECGGSTYRSLAAAEQGFARTVNVWVSPKSFINKMYAPGYRGRR